jgi:CHAD domain-containing protein
VVPGHESQPTPDASALDHVRWALGRHVRWLLAHDPGVRLGREPESLHQMRVATRQLRAVLRAARPC